MKNVGGQGKNWGWGPSGAFEVWFIVVSEATPMWDPGDSKQLRTPIQVSLGTIMENVLEMLWIGLGHVRGAAVESCGPGCKSLFPGLSSDCGGVHW